MKHQPRGLAEFVDQKQAVDRFLAWLRSWKPGVKPLLFHGPPGVGKTALVEAYAEERGLDLVEMNASDFRSAARIDEVVGRSMMQASLTGKPRLFLIDEVDGLAGREDAGGVDAILRLVKGSRHPVVLTANNVYDPKLRMLRYASEPVAFRKLTVWDIVKRLEQVCMKEGVHADKELLRLVATRSEGDLRSALNDLETLSRGEAVLTEKSLDSLGFRERETNVFDALRALFKASSVVGARTALDGVEKTPEELFQWIESNIAEEYEDPVEVARAFDALSRADLFRQRIISTQNWKLLAYSIDMMTGGVALAKREPYRKFTKYRYPDLLMVLGRTRLERARSQAALRKLGALLHCSTSTVRWEFLPYLRIIAQNPGFRNELGQALELDEEGLEALLGASRRG
ncbi:MAG: replication factor C large subunit [Candidatus Bathyarchaeia archaeon]